MFLIATITAAYLVLPLQTRELFHPELASNSNTKVLGVQAKNEIDDLKLKLASPEIMMTTASATLTDLSISNSISTLNIST